MENFDKAPPEKRQAVINAGFSCFGKDGYQKTAMSEIAKMAGVSKASLFHYFGTKKELYHFLFKFSSDKIAREIPSGTDDFFECIWIGSEVKMRVMAIYPGMYDFLVSIAKEDDKDFLEELYALNSDNKFTPAASIFENVNWDKLKPEIDRQTATELVTYVSNGYVREHAGIEAPEVIAAKLKALLEILKNAIYKEDYLL